jgi:hypothetical protein
MLLQRKSLTPTTTKSLIGPVLPLAHQKRSPLGLKYLRRTIFMDGGDAQIPPTDSNFGALWVRVAQVQPSQSHAPHLPPVHHYSGPPVVYYLPPEPHYSGAGLRILLPPPSVSPFGFKKIK